MNTILPNYQRTHPSMASRKRASAEVAKKVKPVFPTSHSPHPPSSSNVERMSIADSAILRASLTLSRYNWTHNAFTKFTPEPAARTQGQQGGKRYLSEVSPAGVYTVCIGPHMFFETKFFTVYTPPPPAAPVAPTTSSAGTPPPTISGASGGGASAGATTVSTPTELPSSPIHMIPGGSPAPERVIELILARTSTPTPFEEEDKDGDGAKSLPSELAGQRELETTLMESIQTLEPVVMDSNKNNIAHIHGGAAGDIPSRAGTPGLGGSGVNSGSTGRKGGAGSGASGGGGAGGQQPVKPPRPERQVAFEFKDNPGHRWLFPQEASVDFTPAGEGSEYGKVSASFCLPVYDDNKMPIPPGQMTTMVIVGPSQSLYEGILAAVNDPTITYKALMEKMKQIPPRAYPEYQLPIDYPDEKLEPLGLKKLPDHKVVPISSLQPSKRKPDGYDLPPTKQRKPNRMSMGTEETAANNSSRPSGSQKRAVTPTVVPSSSPSVTTAPASASASSAASIKRCVYCGCTTTPMWRRGPAGPSTLCNACGVKWKNGKILQETPKPPSSKLRQYNQNQQPTTQPQQKQQQLNASSSASSSINTISSMSAPTQGTASSALPGSSTSISTGFATTASGGVGPTAIGARETNKSGGAPQKTTVEAAAELLKNFVEAVNNPRQNGVVGGQPMSRSSSTRGGSGSSRRSGGGALTQQQSAAKRDASQLSESSVASESEGSRMSEAVEKMVPVKKRHSSKAQATAASLNANASTSSSTASSSPSSASTQIQKSAQSAQAESAQKNAKSAAGGTPSNNNNTNNKDSTPAQTGTNLKSTKGNTNPLASGGEAITQASSPGSSAASPATTVSASTSATTSPTIPSAPTVTVVTPTPAASPAGAASTPGTASATPPTVKGKASAASKASGSSAASRTTGNKPSTSPSTSSSSATISSSLSTALASTGSRVVTAKAKTNSATTPTATTSSTLRPSPPTSAGAKLELLKALANSPRYQISHAAAVSTMNLADDGLSLFATKNLYTNNTATFPLHFPTISIAFGPNNAYYTYPNCAVILYENHFQIKLIQSGERTQIDVWKEGIEGTEFQVVDVGDGESMIVFRAVLRQYMTRFDKELLNPDRNETLIVFRFRERLDGGGPPVKPLLEQWLTTEIPVAPTGQSSQQHQSVKSSPTSSSSSAASTPAKAP
ncbi:hypothetical protein BGW41_005031 [Actinomortierella wolfii]|nr:hypothetical protein BGW41_005031 [Actinomortierella wolfii]